MNKNDTGCLAALIMIIVLYILSWLIICGLFYLICLCFNWGFSLLIATGIWLILIIMKDIF